MLVENKLINIKNFLNNKYNAKTMEKFYGVKSEF